HQQAVGVDVLAIAGDHAQAVAVAGEGDAEVGVEALHHVDQVDQVVRLARIRVVVGEGAVDLAVQGLDVGADGGQHARADLAGDTVAGIDHDLQCTVDLDVGGDPLDVVVGDVALGDAARRG